VEEAGMDGGIGRSDPELLKPFRGKSLGDEESVTQIGGGINVSRVIDMTIGVQVLPPNLIGFGKQIHRDSPNNGHA
jgi:hypothetical protein